MPKLRLIEHKGIRFLTATYIILKDYATPKDKVIVDLIRISMKSCVRHYHALPPQLDLLATQWGVDLDDLPEVDDLGSLRSERVRSHRQKELDEQLRTQVRDARKQPVGNQEAGPSGSGSSSRTSRGKTSNPYPDQSEELERMTRQAKGEKTKCRKTEGALSKIEEDYRMLQKQ
jgi:hypothetical protein